MKTHQQHLKLRSGKFSIERHHFENIGLNERLVSMFFGGVLMSSGLRNPFKGKFLYGAYLAYRGLTGQCLIYEKFGIDAKKHQAVNVRGEFVIDRPAAEVYAYWRNLNNLSASVKRLLNVEMVDESLSRWRSKVMGNLLSINWEAEIVKDEPGRLIGWRSVKNSLINHVGRVEFEQTPDGLSTILKIVLSYRPPIGGIGIGLSKLVNPYFEKQLKKEIRNFKYVIENRAPVFI